MPYVSSTFISSYASTAKTLRILNSTGQIVFSINVCNYDKSSVIGSNLNIVLEDNVQQYILDFSSSTEALQALVLFKQAVDTLRVNCNPTTSGGGGSGSITVTPIPISYLSYKTLQSTNNLIAFQWYDVTDTTGLLFTSGTTIRLQPLNVNDFHPTGELQDATQAKVSINSLSDDVVFYEQPINRVTLINAKPSDQAIDSSCSNILVKTGSKLTAQTSNYVEVDNKSTVTLLGCNYLKATNNSQIVISNANNISFDSITQDFSGFSFNLSNVTINPYDSIGKMGQTTINSSKTVEAYYDVVDQLFLITTDDNSFTLTLENKITQANSDFRVKYTGSGSGNIITINNIDTTQIFQITDAQIGFWVVFRFNLSTLKYEFVEVQASSSVGLAYYVESPTDGQTLFPLPIPSTNPLELEMFINGQKKIYNLDFTYDGSTQSVTYLVREFIVESTDDVEFVIY